MERTLAVPRRDYRLTAGFLALDGVLDAEAFDDALERGLPA